MSKGMIAKDLNINLGGGQGGSALKRAAVNDVNQITLKAGTKFYYWVYDQSLPGWNKWVKKEVTDTGQLQGNAFFYQWLSGGTCYSGFEKGYTDDKGALKAIPANSAMFGVGGWYFYFTLNGKYVWPEYSEAEPSATLELSLPKSGLNLKTGNLYQIGDVINIYNYRWNYNMNTGLEITFELLSSETLSKTNDTHPDYFKLKAIQVNSLNNIMIGEIFPIVNYDKNPVVKLQGDNTPPSWDNGYLPVSQYLYKEFKFNNLTYRYYFGGWWSSLNEPDYGGFKNYKFIPGTYQKVIYYPVSERINNTVNTSFNYHWENKTVVISQGSPNPFSLTIPSDKVQRTTFNFSVKCGGQIIQPSFYYMVRKVSNPQEKWGWYFGGYISNGSGVSYLLKVGGAYEFMINYEGKSIMVMDTIKSSNTVIVIDNDSFCTF